MKTIRLASFEFEAALAGRPLASPANNQSRLARDGWRLLLLPLLRFEGKEGQLSKPRRADMILADNSSLGMSGGSFNIQTYRTRERSTYKSPLEVEIVEQQRVEDS